MSNAKVFSRGETLSYSFSHPHHLAHIMVQFSTLLSEFLYWKSCTPGNPLSPGRTYKLSKHLLKTWTNQGMNKRINDEYAVKWSGISRKVLLFGLCLIKTTMLFKNTNKLEQVAIAFKHRGCRRLWAAEEEVAPC